MRKWGRKLCTIFSQNYIGKDGALLGQMSLLECDIITVKEFVGNKIVSFYYCLLLKESLHLQYQCVTCQ
jgi:hypothetical protein